MIGQFSQTLGLILMLAVPPVNAKITERPRPRTLVQCVSPEYYGTQFEVYLMPPPQEAPGGWDTILEVSSPDRNRFAEDRKVRISYHNKYVLYSGERFTLSLMETPTGNLYGELIDSLGEYPSVFHCQAMR